MPDGLAAKTSLQCTALKWTPEQSAMLRPIFFTIPIISGCVSVLADTGVPDALSLDDVRPPCDAKESSAAAATDETSDAFARVLGEVPGADFGKTADVVGDLNGDGCDDLAVGVVEWDASFDTVIASYVLLFRGPFAEGTFMASEADARIERDTTGWHTMPPRSAGDTNLDGSTDLWIDGNLLESPFLATDTISRSTATLVYPQDNLDVAGGFDADGDGAVDVLAVRSYAKSATLAYGPFSGEVPLLRTSTPQSLLITYDQSDEHEQPAAQWVRSLDGNGLDVAVIGFWDTTESAEGWVLEVSGDRRNETLFASGEDALLENAIAIADATGDGVPDFLSGLAVCDGAKVATSVGEDSCDVVLPGIARTALDVDGDSVVDVFVPHIGFVSVINGVTYAAPSLGMWSTDHSGDLTGDGMDDLILFDGKYGEASGLGELRLYDGATLSTLK